MPIELHCPNCGKLMRAPDNAGGKRGKCPACEQSVYIPMPPDQIEEIPLAPVDLEDEQREEALREEAARYTAAISHEDKIKEGSRAEPAVPPSDVPGVVVSIGDEVERFVLAMRDSELGEAEEVVEVLKGMRARSRDYIEGRLADQIPLDIPDVPPPVVKGFLKNLLERIS